MPESAPSFMLCFLACGKEEGEEEGGWVVEPHTANALNASLKIYFSEVVVWQ